MYRFSWLVYFTSLAEAVKPNGVDVTRKWEQPIGDQAVMQTRHDVAREVEQDQAIHPRSIKSRDVTKKKSSHAAGLMRRELRSFVERGKLERQKPKRQTTDRPEGYLKPFPKKAPKTRKNHPSLFQNDPPPLKKVKTIDAEGMGCNAKNKPGGSCGIGTLTVNFDADEDGNTPDAIVFQVGGNKMANGYDGKPIKSWRGIGIAVVDTDCNLVSTKFYNHNGPSYKQLPIDIKAVPLGSTVMIATVDEPVTNWKNSNKDTFDNAFRSCGLKDMNHANVAYRDGVAAVGRKCCDVGDDMKVVATCDEDCKDTVTEFKAGQEVQTITLNAQCTAPLELQSKICGGIAAQADCDGKPSCQWSTNEETCAKAFPDADPAKTECCVERVDCEKIVDKCNGGAGTCKEDAGKCVANPVAIQAMSEGKAVRMVNLRLGAVTTLSIVSAFAISARS